MKLTGRKLKMSQVWDNARVTPVTLIAVQKDYDSALSELKKGDKIKVSGVSKGRGFQGVVKRHGFHGGPQTHGQKNRLRAPGSIGATAPQRVIKGKKMAGHMGAKKVTVRNLEVVEIRPEERILLVRGAVPGANKSVLEIRK